MEFNPLGEMVLLHADDAAIYLLCLEESLCFQDFRNLDVGFPDPYRTLFTRKGFCIMCALVLNMDTLNPEIFHLKKTLNVL